MDVVKIKTEPIDGDVVDREFINYSTGAVKDELIMRSDIGLSNAGRQSRKNVSKKIIPVRSKRNGGERKHVRKQRKCVEKPSNRAKRKSDQYDNKKDTKTSIKTENNQYVKSYVQCMKSCLYDDNIGNLNVAKQSDMIHPKVEPTEIEGVFNSSRIPLEFDICSKELRNIRDNIIHDNFRVKEEPIDIDEIDIKKEILDQEDFFIKNDFDEVYEGNDNHDPLDKESEEDDCEAGDLSHLKYASLKRHQMSHWDSDRLPGNAKTDGYVCATCYKECPTQRSLAQHRLVHSQDRPHLCRICKTSFKEQATLRRHMWTHLEKQHKCTICDKDFVEKHSMNRHIRTIHADYTQGKEPISVNVVCETCKKDFKSELLYKKHALRHGNPDFECPHCKKVYAGPSHLRVHVRIHTGEKPYPCDICSVRFTFKHVLKKHLKRMHMRGVKYECNLCSKSFERKVELSKHLTGHLTERPDGEYLKKKKLNRVKKLQQEILLLNNVLLND